LSGGSSGAVVATLCVFAPGGVLVLAPLRGGGAPPSGSRKLPAAPLCATGLHVVVILADGGQFVAGVASATFLSDTVPVAAICVQQVPLAATPPVLASAE